MGREIDKSTFSAEDHQRFVEHLERETDLLEQWFRKGRFQQRTGVCGLELEGWLVDRQWQPAAVNEPFLECLDDPLVVPELSRFNFEINATPQPLDPHMFRQLHGQLSELWKRCAQCAAALDSRALQIGILPTLRDDALTLDNISRLQRYYALNQRVLESRRGSPIEIDIVGPDGTRLRASHDNVMTEAATTSLQMHLQVDGAQAVRFYNAAQIASAATVGLSGNSPFVFGHQLWEETRIPLFEQAVSVPAFFDKPGHIVERVTFGTGYIAHSLMELLVENRHAFPVLLPLPCSDDIQRLEHLRLHNGTIWRWNRPLIDFTEDETPTLRIEHRVVPAGPSLSDDVANILFFYGISHHLAGLEKAPERSLPFEHARANFYQAARLGLQAPVFWLDGREYILRELLLEQLLPQVDSALTALGIDRVDIDHYLHGIIAERIASGQTGAQWQKRYIAQRNDFAELTRAYYQWQNQDIPVHRWTL